MANEQQLLTTVNTLTAEYEAANAAYEAYMGQFDWMFESHADDDDMMDAYEQLAASKSEQLQTAMIRAQLREAETQLIEAGKKNVLVAAYLDEASALSYLYAQIEKNIVARRKVLAATINYFSKLYAA